MRAAWQRMLSGRRLDILDPSPLDVEIEHIAHGLARVSRWNGQTSGADALSVAEHSVLVERIAGLIRPDPDDWERLAALLHDSHEYAVGDLISPVKRALGLSVRSLETRPQEAIHVRFSLPPTLPRDLKRLFRKADRAAAHLEAIQVGEYRPERGSEAVGPIAATGRGHRIAGAAVGR